jgi:hypothetical protein
MSRHFCWEPCDWTFAKSILLAGEESKRPTEGRPEARAQGFVKRQATLRLNVERTLNGRLGSVIRTDVSGSIGKWAPGIPYKHGVHPAPILHTPSSSPLLSNVFLTYFRLWSIQEREILQEHVQHWEALPESGNGTNRPLPIFFCNRSEFC